MAFEIRIDPLFTMGSQLRKSFLHGLESMTQTLGVPAIEGARWSAYIVLFVVLMIKDLRLSLVVRFFSAATTHALHKIYLVSGILCKAICQCMAFRDIILILLETPAEISAHINAIYTDSQPVHGKLAWGRRSFKFVRSYLSLLAWRHMWNLYATFAKNKN